MIRSTSTLLNVVLVGDSETNARAKSHFEGRTAAFITMTVADAQADLMQQGLDPIWNWDEWHSSMPNDDGDDDWRNENTIHTAEWDDLHTHAHELNHLRFYIPYLSVVKDAGHVFFIDDDILVQKDLHQVTKSVSDKVGPNAGLTCPCNIWTWNDDCHHFDFKSRHANILEVSPLYGGRPTCSGDGGEDDKFCLPENFDDFVRRATPEGIRAEDQTGTSVYLPYLLSINLLSYTSFVCVCATNQQHHLSHIPSYISSDQRGTSASASFTRTIGRSSTSLPSTKTPCD